jgi:hypothetical protein
MKNPTINQAENQEAIKLAANNPIFPKRTKHIAIKYHYTRDLIGKGGAIKLDYRPTSEMIADGLIKRLGTGANSTRFVEQIRHG